MAATESDGATAAQKCDPYALAYDECEGFLRGEEGEEEETHTLIHTHTHTHARTHARRHRTTLRLQPCTS